MNEEELAIAAELGETEMDRRIDELEHYDKYDTFVSISEYEFVFTPAQAVAYANFAALLGKGYVIAGTTIKKPKSRDGLELRVVQKEKRARQQAAREAAEG